MRPYLKRLNAGVVVLLGFAWTVGAHAAYPDRPIHLVVPFEAGGGSDVVARTVGQALSESFGQSVVVENRPGAGGIIGAAFVAKAPPDGYTILLGSGATHGSGPVLYPHVPYDALKDFAPVTLLTVIPNVLVAAPSLPATTVKELIDEAKARRDPMNYASAGNGSSSHLTMELFKSITGVSLTHIPYKGAGPALVAVMSGDPSVMFVDISVALPQIRAGRIRALAVTTAKRVAALPDTPTGAESGVPNFVVNAWTAILAPAGTPPEVVNRLNGEIAKVLASDTVKQRLGDLGHTVAPGTPEALAHHISAELSLWSEVARKANIKLD